MVSWHIMLPMAELVSVDRAGRVVLPKAIRDALGIDERTKLLVAVGEHGQLVLQKVDVEAIAGRLEKELAGKDVDAIVRKVRKEMKALARRRYPDLFACHERLGGGGEAPNGGVRHVSPPPRCPPAGRHRARRKRPMARRDAPVRRGVPFRDRVPAHRRPSPEDPIRPRRRKLPGRLPTVHDHSRPRGCPPCRDLPAGTGGPRHERPALRPDPGRGHRRGLGHHEGDSLPLSSVKESTSKSGGGSTAGIASRRSCPCRTGQQRRALPECALPRGLTVVRSHHPVVAGSPQSAHGAPEAAPSRGPTLPPCQAVPDAMRPHVLPAGQIRTSIETTSPSARPSFDRRCARAISSTLSVWCVRNGRITWQSTPLTAAGKHFAPPNVRPASENSSIRTPGSSRRMSRPTKSVSPIRRFSVPS